MNNLVIFLTYTFLTAFTPGPNNILVISNTSKYGLKKSSRLLQGIFLGLLFVMIFCSAFSIMLVNIMPTIKPAMTYIGAGYIFWIAWNIVKSKSQSDTKNVDKADSFMTGFLLQFVNIKIILYGITAISNFIMPYYNSPISIGGFTLLITSFGCVGTFTWAIFGVVFQSFFKKYNSIINIIMALLLAYCAISLII